MPDQIKESDWKIIKQLHLIALERCCQQNVAKIGSILADKSKTALDRFHDAHDLIKEQRKELADFFDDCRRSSAKFQLAHISRRKLLTEEEIGRLSEETRKWIDKALQIK